MKSLVLISLLSSLLSVASSLPRELLDRGEELPLIHEVSLGAEAYSSGAVHMSLMDLISQSVAELKEGSIMFDPVLALPAISKFTPCVDGFSGTKVNQTYACNNLDMYSFTPHEDMGSEAKVGNDIWGWSFTEGDVTREFGLIGQQDGTAFVEITKDGQTIYLGRLPTQTEYSIWRDIKVIKNHAYIGSEALGHGIQIFDLTKLLDKNLAKSPQEFSIESDLTAHYPLPVGSSHNIVAHEQKNLIAAVGSLPRSDDCGAGLIFVDVSDPAKPQSAGCAGEDGYTHDAQCLTYYGPHVEFNGTDVCYSYNENTLTIYNVTTPQVPTIISTSYYYGVSYSHQGWVVDEKDQRYLLLDDELDEVWGRGWGVDGRTVTYVWDIQDLRNPVMTGHHKSSAKAIDHNLYVVDGLAYEANYCSGLRVVNVSSVSKDPTGAGFKEVAFFDVYPEDDEVNGVVKFGGAWSSYPYFKSGFILVNSMERGLFVLKLQN